ncbi:MAG TPA: retropepsin-like aspartic protease [Asticcacaulis sp.]|nr:retropepsin-like aspartic protease [Asticcacaulis sp.]
MRDKDARLTRRVFAGAGLGLLGWPLLGPALAQTAAQTAAQTETQTDAQDKDDAASLAARVDTANHLKVEARINGEGPFSFVVDTGAERSVIADNVAATLGLPAGPMVTVDGISSRIQAPSVRVERLEFGPFTRRRLNLPVLSRANLLADGYLGLDAIDDAQVTFDFAHRLVRIDDSSQYAVMRGDARVRAEGRRGHLRIGDSRVDSVAATAFIDTGAEVSVGNPALYAALKSRNPALVELGALMLSGVTGGQLPGVVIPVKRILVQDILFSDGTLVIADPPDFTTWKLDNHPALLIGLDYLRQFASVTIDYRNQEMRFNLADITPRPTPTVSIEQMG